MSEKLSEVNQFRYDLLDDLYLFHRVMFEQRTGREFMISRPVAAKSHFKSICDDLTDAFLLKTTRLMINCPPGWAKAIDVDTLILTKLGWKKAKDIIIGDEVVGSSEWTKIIGVHPQGIVSAKQILFSDNTSVICNSDHKWGVYNRDTPNHLKIKTTNELYNQLFEADGRKKWRIPLVNGNFGEIKPDIDPYLFGCWLGDGNSYSAAITTMDIEIKKEFENYGYIISERAQRNGKARNYGITKNGFSEYLRHKKQLGNKHFPNEAYLWSKDNRLLLIQGLMDTDGTCDNFGESSFCNKNMTIIEGMEYLISSIGGITKRISALGGSVKLKIRVPENTKLFKLERKQKKLCFYKRGLPKRLIKEIKSIDSREMICFTVDADDQLFAVSKNLILTHNSELCKSFICWCFAHYPDCKFLYISHSFELATIHTASIRQTMMMPIYKKLFEIEIRRDSSAKDYFQTTAGGTVAAFGSQGGITGHDAGLPGQDRFTGAVVIDDIHKPEDIHSDTIRERVKRNYFETIERRLRAPNVPIILIGQRLHEDDLMKHILDGADGRIWRKSIIKALDDAGNARYPEVNPVCDLVRMREKQPYVFASQYQQDPMPAGGALFKTDWFVLLDETPKIIATFITCDTAETEKEYNDATVFSFWGVYQLTFNSTPIDELYGLHWIDCLELRIEPKDLEDSFLDFWGGSMRYHVKPKFVAIEKKSTGVTLLSVLKKVQGLRTIDIERSGSINSKTNRFLEIQQYIANKQISLPSQGKHTRMCINHMSKITANNTHRWDDLADTAADAIKMALIDKIILTKEINPINYNNVARNVMSSVNQIDRLKRAAYMR